MADTKISDLDEATTLDDTDLFVIAKEDDTNEYITAANLATELGAGNLVLLHDETLAGTGTFDVSGISGNYRDLILEMTLRANDASNEEPVCIRFNNDSGTNYDRATFAAEAGIGGGRATGQDKAEFVYVPAASSTAGYATYCTMKIPSYAGTTFHKGYHVESISMHNSTIAYFGGAGSWHSTSAITRIQIFPGDGGSFIAGSSLRIYGVDDN